MTELELLSGYREDFIAKTGKSIKIKICSRWEAACQLPIKMEIPLVIDMILDAAGWNWEEVFTSCRRTVYIFRRGLIFFILVKAGFPLLKIAAYTGKEHTTIINAYRKFENRLDTEPLTSMVLTEVMDFIRSNYLYYLNNNNIIPYVSGAAPE